MSAQKEKGIYVIRNNEGIVAKIRWNIFSSHFKVYDDMDNLIEEIIYNFNFKGWNGPTKLKILLPKTEKNSKRPWNKNKNKKIVQKIENKMPEYSDLFHVYVLKFINRKVIPNERNIQLINTEYKEDNNNILLQFAQSDQNEFILDYKYPFNNITAFALGITSLSSSTGFIGIRYLAVCLENPSSPLSFLLTLNLTCALVGIPFLGLSVGAILSYSSVPI